MGVIVGEIAFQHWVDRTEVFEFNMKAFRVYAKVCVTYASLPEIGGDFGAVIDSIKRKKPDGQIEEVRIWSNVVYDDNMTNIKYAVLVSPRTRVHALVDLQFWS